MRAFKGKIFLLLFLGLLIRLLVIPQPGFEADIAYWKTWSLAASDKGIYWLATNTNYNYPAGFALILWLIGRFYSLFSNPNNFNQFWQANNYLFLLLIKLPSIMADLIAGFSLYYLISKPKLLDLPEKFSKFALLIAGLYVFHPAVIYDGAWWGQVDSLGIVFALLSYLFLVIKKPLWASVFLTLGFQLKLQTMIFFPLFFLYVWRSFSWKEMVKTLATGFLVFAVTSFPFILANDLGRTFRLIIQNSDWFPFASLRAFNLWWLVTLGAGMETSDKILTFGITSAKTAGLIIFSATYFYLSVFLLIKPNPKNLLIAFMLASFSFFLFPTQSHERYILPTVALLLPLLCFYWENKNQKIFSLIVFVVLSVNTLLGLNMSMIANYPNNGLPFLSGVSWPVLGIIISAINLIIFSALFFQLILKKIPLYLTVFTLIIVCGGFLAININYLLNKPIPLSQLKPLNYDQSYSSPQMNMTTNSVFGPKSWTLLSSNYYFFRKGIGSHANSKIQYDLAGKFSKFTTLFGVDTNAGQTASVIFQIMADNKIIYTSNKLGKFDFPGYTEIDVKGVKTLTLLINDANDGINGDHADWLEPTLWKK